MRHCGKKTLITQVAFLGAKAVAKNNMSKRSFISLASSGRSVKILGGRCEVQ